MSFGKLLALYGICAAVFFAIDFVWLSTAVNRIYRPQMGSLLADKPKLGVAGVFYLLYVVGILVFAVLPGLARGSLAVAAGWGALFGFFTYATYDVTNLATLRDWPLRVVVVDILWGVVLCTLVASAGFLLGRWLRSAG